MTDEPLTNVGRTANANSSHRRAVARREAVVAAAVADERARLREAVEAMDRQTTTVSGAQRGPILQARHEAYLSVLALLEEQP